MAEVMRGLRGVELGTAVGQVGVHPAGGGEDGGVDVGDEQLLAPAGAASSVPSGAMTQLAPQ
jgi:hypothetical protein